MSAELFMLYIVTVLVASALPGPMMLLAMTNGARAGARSTLPTFAGSALGNLLLMAVSALGLGALLYSSASWFAAVKWLGAAYLIFLGIRLWRAPVAGADQVPVASPHCFRRHGGLFAQAWLVAVSNPKGVVFFGALFPQFLDPAAPQWPQFLILAATFLTIDFCWQLVYARSGQRIMRWLRTPRHVRGFNRIGGGAFMGAGLLMLAVKR